MPTLFCLKNMGVPSSKNIANATKRKTGIKIIKITKANKRLYIGRKRLKSSN